MGDESLKRAMDELFADYLRQPWWRRAWWRVRAWIWPVRWCAITGSLEVLLPVAYLAGGMMGVRRWTWLWSMRWWPRRVPVGFRLQIGPLWTWTRVWPRSEDEQ